MTSRKLGRLETLSGLDILLNVDTNGMKLIKWAEENKNEIEFLVQENGALLLRGLNLYSSKQLGDFLSIIFQSKLSKYTNRSTPRTELRNNIYTATEYPPSEIIPLHNENSYSRNWPSRIGLYCMIAPEEGGQTPICDSHKVYNKIPKDIRNKFEEKGVMYVRNYSAIDLPWSEVFQTKEKGVVEQYCKENGMKFEWFEDNSLRTVQVNPSTIVHPVSGKKLWFNQAHLFHVSNLSKEIQTTLINTLGESRLPRNTYYGDNTPIEPFVLDTIREIYNESKISFDWSKNDIILLDNLQFAHGREPFNGTRKILVGMA
jgi:alpha-ketoglutarate-dependent taurine dioxygenase